MKHKFPNNFLWGTATSSHQIEGNNKNNEWWQAEQKGTIKHKSGIACDSYNKYEEDFDLAKKLGNNAHRFSIEWSRIEPEEGNFNKNEIEHYRKVIHALKERNIEPFVTLHHFTNPVWFMDKGGWTSKNSVHYFCRYADYVMKHLGDDVKYCITINEPLIYAMLAYKEGNFPPHKKGWYRYAVVARRLAKAHKQAYRIIKKHNPHIAIGVAKNNQYYEAYKNNILSKAVKNIIDYTWNIWFLNKIDDNQDFVGINYYFHNRIRVYFTRPINWLKQNENKNVSDFGWEIYPEGIYHVVKQASRYNKPVFIFENGIADKDDKQRVTFIKEHLKWLHKAIKEGVDVQGYFHWSLLDNFEWAEGFTMKFGLVEVDFDTLERNPRDSFYFYKKVCTLGELDA